VIGSQGMGNGVGSHGNGMGNHTSGEWEWNGQSDLSGVGMKMGSQTSGE
jgi:hypothetical protein